MIDFETRQASTHKYINAAKPIKHHASTIGKVIRIYTTVNLHYNDKRSCLYIYFHAQIEALFYCLSTIPTPPLCLRAVVQDSFPGLTVYSNYQANKSPPCAVMGEGESGPGWRGPLW